MEGFGDVIKKERLAKGLKMREVSAATGIDQGLLSKFERGVRLPTENQIAGLASCYGVTLRDLRVIWLADGILNQIKKYPDIAREAYHAAERRIEYMKVAAGVTEILISDHIKARLDKIDALHRIWQAHKPLDALQLQKLQSYYQVLNSYESNKIEGNTLTYMETELVINQGVTVQGKPLVQHLEAINHGHAIDFLHGIVQDQSSFDERLLLQVHRLILQSINQQYAGRYRDVPVRIGGSEHTPPEPYLINKLMEGYFQHYLAHHKTLHPVILAAEMHERLVTIHPFLDGNGRTSRLIMNFVLLQHGYTIATLKGDDSSRLRYYRALEEVQVHNEPDHFYELICDVVEASLHDHLRWVIPDYQE